MPQQKGKDSPNWKGGRDKDRHDWYNQKVYKDWKAAVLLRDEHACKGIGCNKKEKLHAHHIKNWYDYPDLRFEVSNGITLCIGCHTAIHKREERKQGQLGKVKQKPGPKPKQKQEVKGIGNKPRNIIDAFEKDEFFGKQFQNKESWRKWVTFLKVVYGLKLEESERRVYEDCTSRSFDDVPDGGFEEFYGIVGRRGGKSTISSLIASYEALYGGWEAKLAPGERGSIFIVAPDRQQAKIIFDYCDSMMDNFRDLIVRQTTELISLENGIDIVVKSASKRGLRGFSTVCVILDEIAFLRTDDYANPAEEILTALDPSLKEGAKLIGISTPYAKFGYFYEIYQEYFGRKGSEIMVWQASTLYMHPTFSKHKIKRAKRKDITRATTEYDAIFREDISSYLTEDELQVLTDTGVKERLPEEECKYYCFVDVSGARHDSFTFSIAHVEDEKIIIDVIYEKVPHFDIEQQIRICSDYAKKFGIRQVTGDKYGGEFPIQGFKKEGIQYFQSEIVKSDLFLEFQIICNLQKVVLLDSDRLRKQFIILERTAGQSGKDRVEKPKNTHDDIANVVAGVSVMAYLKIARRPSEEELKSREFRKVTRAGLEYATSWDKILKDAEKEMKKDIQKRKEG